MNVLIITDLNNNHFLDKFNRLCNVLDKVNSKYKVFNVNDLSINYCLSCYSCWLKNPGVCLISDDIRYITEYFYKSEFFIIFSEIKFGCYSSKIKTIIERLLINMLPFFENRQELMFHASRYSKIPTYIMIGYGENLHDKEKKIFNDMVKKNAININQNKFLSMIIDTDKSEIRYGDI